MIRGYRPRAGHLTGAAGGVLAALAGLATGSLVAAVLGSRQTPVVAVGSAFIDRVPPWLKDLAIRLFGVHDKTALRIGIVAVLIALAALAGAVTRWRPWAGLGLTAAIAGIAVVAAASRPDSGRADLMPSLVAGGVAVLLLWLFARRLPDEPSGDGAVARRGFLQLAAGVLLGTAGVGAAARLIGGRRNRVVEARDQLRLPLPPSTAAPPGVQAPEATSWVTPNADFYRIDTALSVPLIVPRDWRLRIHGMVATELTLSLDDLLKRDVVHRWITLCCVSNEVGGDLIGNALWSGVPLKGLLAEAGVDPAADAVLSTSEDGWTCGTPLSALTDDRGSLLAFAMNGEPLPLEHGFPVRIVVPGLYGYVSATKWLTGIEVSRFDRFDAYWTPRGWSEQAPVKLASRIDVPRSKVPAGRVVVAGVAWHQHAGVSKVEVRVDGGPWQQATVAADASIDTWRQWHWTWDAPRGNHVLQVRATGTDGTPQSETAAPPAPDGATGLHTVDVKVE